VSIVTSAQCRSRAASVLLIARPLTGRAESSRRPREWRVFDRRPSRRRDPLARPLSRQGDRAETGMRGRMQSFGRWRFLRVQNARARPTYRRTLEASELSGARCRQRGAGRRSGSMPPERACRRNSVLGWSKVEVASQSPPGRTRPESELMFRLFIT
jgi:hypothetical protein